MWSWKYKRHSWISFFILVHFSLSRKVLLLSICLFMLSSWYQPPYHCQGNADVERPGMTTDVTMHKIKMSNKGDGVGYYITPTPIASPISCQTWSGIQRKWGGGGVKAATSPNRAALTLISSFPTVCCQAGRRWRGVQAFTLTCNTNKEKNLLRGAR